MGGEGKVGLRGAGDSGLTTWNPEFSLDLSRWWHILYRFIKISDGLIACEAEFDSQMPGPMRKRDRGAIQGTPPPLSTPTLLPTFPQRNNQLQEGSNLVCGPNSVPRCILFRPHHVFFF